jgi:hypothetical protein
MKPCLKLLKLILSIISELLFKIGLLVFSQNYHLSTSAIYAAHVHAALSQSANLAAASSVGPAVAAALSATPVFQQQFEGGSSSLPQRHQPAASAAAVPAAPQSGSSGHTLQSPLDETGSSRLLGSSCSQNPPGQQDGSATYHHYHHHHHQHHVAFPFGLSQQAFFPALQQTIDRLQTPYSGNDWCSEVSISIR